MSDYPPLPVSVGFAGKCPRCGQGRLFKAYLKVDGQCLACGLDYSKADSGDGPAVFLIFIVGFVATACVFIARFGMQLSIPAAFLLGILVSVGLTFALLQPLKGLMIAIQYRHRAAEGSVDDKPDDWS